MCQPPWVVSNQGLLVRVVACHCLQTAPHCLELFDAKLSSTLCRNFFLFCKVSFLASFCSRFTSSVLPRLNASLPPVEHIYCFVTHGLLLGYVFTTLVGISMSTQNLTYAVMVSTCSSREAPVSMTSQSV